MVFIKAVFTVSLCHIRVHNKRIPLIQHLFIKLIPGKTLFNELPDSFTRRLVRGIGLATYDVFAPISRRRYPVLILDPSWQA